MILNEFIQQDVDMVCLEVWFNRPLVFVWPNGLCMPRFEDEFAASKMNFCVLAKRELSNHRKLKLFIKKHYLCVTHSCGVHAGVLFG